MQEGEGGDYSKSGRVSQGWGWFPLNKEATLSGEEGEILSASRACTGSMRCNTPLQVLCGQPVLKCRLSNWSVFR